MDRYGGEMHVKDIMSLFILIEFFVFCTALEGKMYLIYSVK
jgi:hypothetical protein